MDYALATTVPVQNLPAMAEGQSSEQLKCEYFDVVGIHWSRVLLHVPTEISVLEEGDVHVASFNTYGYSVIVK